MSPTDESGALVEVATARPARGSVALGRARQPGKADRVAVNGRGTEGDLYLPMWLSVVISDDLAWNANGVGKRVHPKARLARRTPIGRLDASSHIVAPL